MKLVKFGASVVGILLLCAGCSKQVSPPVQEEAPARSEIIHEEAPEVAETSLDVASQEVADPRIQELNELAEKALRRGATPPVIFDYEHGVAEAGDVGALKLMIEAAQPGDVVTVPEGIYHDTGLIELITDGTQSNPITLVASEPGRVVITGESAMAVTGDYWIIKGLLFQDAAYYGTQYQHIFHVTGANGVRVTECAFISCGSPDVKYLAMMSWKDGASDGRVDHCTFVDSLSMNLSVRVGPKDSDSATGIRIDHNHFRDIRRRHVNGGEAIQIGQNPQTYGRLRGGAVVENNRFERCDGDDEVISNKSSGNIIRDNTFIGCGGAVWLRGGTDCEISNNLWRGGSSGIVAHGMRHAIRGNVIEGTHSYAFFAQYGSDWEHVENAGHSFEALQDSVIEDNAIINSVIRGLVYGAFRNDSPGNNYRTVAPQNNTFRSNVITGRRGTLLIAEHFGPTRFIDNMLYAEGEARLGNELSGFRTVSAERAVAGMPRVREMDVNEVGASWLR